jgi:putative sterol carrier protein
MVVFPSQEWAELFQLQLNANPAYAEAASAWEGDILLLVLPDVPGGAAPGVHLDLSHGQCREARFLPDAQSTESEFVYQGRRANWNRLLHHELDPVKAILDGTFQIKGNLAKAMRFTRAAKELVETAAAIPAELGP